MSRTVQIAAVLRVIIREIGAGNITRDGIVFAAGEFARELFADRNSHLEQSGKPRGMDLMIKTTDIREAVLAELDFDPLVDSASITVKNIEGDVALNGTVPSYPQYQEAAAAARRVSGVKQVHNHLMVQLPDADYRDDAQLATAANNALGWDVTVPEGIEATARDGNLTLTGLVDFGSQRLAAERAVSGLTGVRNVKDDIEVSYDADPLDVTLLVEDAIDRNALFYDDSDVQVTVTDNAVTLGGHVRTWAEHDAAVGAAWMASGVYSVIDEMAITG
jgi:osmotically-inducible protein OsmY